MLTIGKSIIFKCRVDGFIQYARWSDFKNEHPYFALKKTLLGFKAQDPYQFDILRTMIDENYGQKNRGNLSFYEHIIEDVTKEIL